LQVEKYVLFNVNKNECINYIKY